MEIEKDTKRKKEKANIYGETERDKRYIQRERKEREKKRQEQQ